MNRYTAGDDIAIRFRLKESGAYQDMTGKSVSAALVTLDRSALAAGTQAVACTIGAVDAQGTPIIAEFPRAQTASIVPGRYVLEVQVESGGKRYTWERVEIYIERGHIA